MLPHDRRAHALQTPYAASGWGPWSPEAMEVSDPGEGPGLLVSRAFWVGGGLSLLLWAGVTVLALRWI